MNHEEDIFEAAAGLPVNERPSFLDKACAGQPGTRARLAALLRSHDATGFMEENAVAADKSDLQPEWARSQPEECGQKIGRYKLLEQIGEGGFGVVWVAEQLEPVRRRVAMKIIKPGMDSREIVGRFEQERQALAMMDHPNIAKVFDAGATDKGRPYFVMELVRGVRITDYCTEANLPAADRLKLFITVCQAVQHAHQKGIIHRDLKPSNILVAPGDAGEPVPKVIDFGVAKAIQQQLTECTVYTQFEQMIGTPAYMSPEQAGLGPMDIDTRSDVYSLGVLLYELLTGRPPFDPRELASAGLDEMRRVIREVEPPRPSTRRTQFLTPSVAGKSAAKAVINDAGSKIDTDLDWIVMKAIEKDRRRRYETANDLALDIHRFLTDEPVSATPPGTAYRLRKFVRRNWLALRVAAAIAVILIAATVVSTSMAVRALQAEKQANLKVSDEIVARKLADQALMNAEKISQFFAGIIRSADPNTGGRSMSVVEAMNLAIGKIEGDISNPTAEEIARLDSMMWTLHKLGFTRRIIPLQEKIRNFCRATYGRQHERSLLSSLNLAFYISRGRGPGEKAEKAIGILEELVAAEGSWPAERNKEWLDTLANLSECYRESNRFNDALRIREKVMQHCKKHYASDSAMTLSAMTALATCLCEAGRVQDAITVREEVLEINRNANGPESPKTLETIHHLANLYHNAGQTEKALALRENVVPLFRKVLGGKNPDTLMAIHNFAESCFEAGRKQEATRLLEEVWALRPEVSGVDHRDTLEAMHDLATCYFDEGRCDQALKLRETVLTLRRQTLGPEHADTLEAMTNLAISWRMAGRVADAVNLQEEACAVMRRVLSWNHAFLKVGLDHMVLLYELSGRQGEAVALRSQIAGEKN